MSSLLGRLLGNIVGLWLATTYISGFVVTRDLKSLAALIALLIIGQIIVRPILNTILAPFLWVTFGLFRLATNALILYAVDFISNSITINGLGALIFGSIIISLSADLAPWLLKIGTPSVHDNH